MPEPSRLVKLDQLYSIKPGTKIRVLGCVHAYHGESARLVLRDHFPATAKSVPTAFVNVESLLDGLNHDLLYTGTWLNIMGYVRTRPVDVKVSRKARVSFIDATMVWSAGTIRLEKYQAAVEDLQECIATG